MQDQRRRQIHHHRSGQSALAVINLHNASTGCPGSSRTSLLLTQKLEVPISNWVAVQLQDQKLSQMCQQTIVLKVPGRPVHTGWGSHYQPREHMLLTIPLACGWGANTAVAGRVRLLVGNATNRILPLRPCPNVSHKFI